MESDVAEPGGIWYTKDQKEQKGRDSKIAAVKEHKERWTVCF